MISIAAVTIALAVGFGMGRVHHPANLKLSAVKAEIAKVEAELAGTDVSVAAKALAVVARLKALL
jgi:hypothetical protein